MKKYLAIFLAATLALTLAACSSKQVPPGAGPADDTGSTAAPETTTAAAAAADPMERLLARAGLRFDDIRPKEPTFDMIFDESDGELTFYMERETSRDAAAFMHGIHAACKAAADDGKLYKPNFAFFMGTGFEELPALPADEEINDGMMFLSQFGYLVGGKTVTVTAARIDDMHPDRGETYYPIYSLSFGF